MWQKAYALVVQQNLCFFSRGSIMNVVLVTLSALPRPIMRKTCLRFSHLRTAAETLPKKLKQIALFAHRFFGIPVAL